MKTLPVGLVPAAVLRGAAQTPCRLLSHNPKADTDISGELKGQYMHDTSLWPIRATGCCTAPQMLAEAEITNVQTSR